MKKAILLSYTFPPLSTGGTPVVLNLCNHLPGNGWKIIPVTVKDHRGMATDETTLNDLPEDLKVYRVPHGKRTAPTQGKASSRGALQRLMRFVIHNYVLVPDRLITWVKDVVPVLERIVREERPHCIISFGPHHSLHLIASRVCRSHTLPHIPFFGDLWLADSYVEWPSRINKLVEQFQERRVVTRARGLVATTEGSTGYFLNRYGDRCPPCHVAENAYDPRRMGPPAPPREKGEFLVAGWTGNFFSSQSPSELIAGLEMFYGRNPDSRLRVRMAGDIDGESESRLHRSPLEGRITHHGRIPWDRVPDFQKDCDLLVCYLSGRKGSELKNSSKTAEYLISGRSVLAIALEGDLTERARKFGRGYTVEPSAADIALKLENIEYQWKTSSLSLPADYRAIENRFSAPSVMERLAGFLDEMAAP